MNKKLIDTLHTTLDSHYIPDKYGNVKTIRASEIGHPCLRYHYYRSFHNDCAEPPDANLMRIFKLGQWLEQIWIQQARKSYRIYNEQQPLEWRKYNITGHIDGMLEIEKDKLIAFDIKTISPYNWKKFNENDTNGWKEFFHHAYYYKYPAQGHIYMILTNTTEFMFILLDKMTLQEKFIIMPLDYDYGEKLIQRAEAINEIMKTGDEPPQIDYDENLCGKLCPFKHICLPARKYEGAAFVDDEQIKEALERYFELKEQAKEYENVYAFLKAELGKYEKSGFCDNGNFEFRIKEIFYKAQPEKIVPAKLERIEKRIMLIDHRNNISASADNKTTQTL